jgi:MOSC domain-containing protein YiiM
MNSVRLLSIQAGLPQSFTDTHDIGPEQRTWATAFHKLPRRGPVWIGKTNIEGDRQASPSHGGPDKAICVYPHEHYSYWKRVLELPELDYGAFAENLTLEGQVEDQCCIGDRIRFGEAVLQVTQPRPPCWRLSRWWGRKDFATLMEQSGRTGWYCRVIEEGFAEAGATAELIARPCPEWTVLLAAHLVYGNSADAAQMEALAACDSLSAGWRDTLIKRRAKLLELS